MPVLVRAAPHASAATRSLDIEEKQILIYFPEDQFRYHHRLLLYHLGDGRWVVLTPTGDLQVDDFARQHFMSLGRDSTMPVEERPYFCFSPLSDEALARYRQAARDRAEILGVKVDKTQVGMPAGVNWVFADTAHKLFNTEVAAGLLADPNNIFLKDSSGMVE